MINKIIHFSDVHLKHKFATKEGFSYLLNTLVSNADPHTLVVLTGDLLHQRVSLDSDASGQVMSLFNTLNSLNIRTIVIKGTRSHDYDYLEAIDTDIFNNITFVTETTELLVDNLTILAVPEEYIDDQEEHYKNTLYNPEKHYNVILFHGTISDVASYNEHIENIPFKKAPSFSKKDFFARSNIVLCGHIHKHQIYRETVSETDSKYLSYAGSWSRLCHGEEEEKSLQILNIYSKDDIEYFVGDYTIVPNLCVTKLYTLVLSERKDETGFSIFRLNKDNEHIIFDNKKLSDDFKELVDICEYATLYNIYIRFLLNDYHKYNLLTKLLKSLESRYKHVSLLLKGKNISNNFVIDVEEREKQNGFISELESCPNLSEEINLFIYNKHNIKLDSNEIAQALAQS